MPVGASRNVGRNPNVTLECVRYNKQLGIKKLPHSHLLATQHKISPSARDFWIGGQHAGYYLGFVSICGVPRIYGVTLLAVFSVTFAFNLPQNG